ncbi:hypothetical protein ACFYYL_42765 [Actinomadura geliboluensis]|uniref:hypothetical protein n=1 Tax=Actinomadura geliboluensis TaxID=882440 RepID=UPI0036A1077C
MRKITRTALTVTAVAATAAALAAVPASAAPITFTVTPGGSVSGTNTQPLRALNTAKGVAAVCSGSTASGSAHSGDGVGLATLTSVAATGCVTTGGLATTITPTGLPWTFNATAYNAGTGVTSGDLTGVQATAVIGNPASPQCTVTVGALGSGPGTITGTHTNSTHRLNVSGSNLRVQTATGPGCGSLASPGDPITLAGEYLLSPAQTITSP